MSIPVKTIAGSKVGIPVTLNAELYPLFQAIKHAAQQGNHWARICVGELEALSSGHLRKSVYLHCNGRQEEFGEFTIILPGCKASFRKNSVGKFYIYALEADVNYTELQRREKRPGLYNVKRDGDEWKTKLALSGYIQERKINVVAICDQFEFVENATLLAPEALTDSKRATAGYLDSNGFDLHFTPGKNRIGGLRNVMQSSKSQTDVSLHGSALLLADTMESARKIKDVTWVSERGGSGVLTQAMRILKDRGVSFKESGHKVFFSNIQTNLGAAEQLTRDISITFDGKTHSKDWYNVNHVVGSGSLGGFVNPIKRRMNDNKYSTLNCISDIGKEVGAYSVAAGGIIAVPAAIKTLGATAVATGVSLAAASSPAGLMFAAVGTAYAAYKAANPIYKGANAVIKSYFPLASHKKLTGK